jgi:hypothetical protein
MERGKALAALVLTGALATVIAGAAQQPPQQQQPQPPGIEKVKDNLYMITGSRIARSATA